MKISFLILLLSLLLEINCQCGSPDKSIESPSAEVCLNRKTTLEEIGQDENLDDFVCCYMKLYESSNSNCFALEKSRINTIKDEHPTHPYAIGCSFDALPDESKSEYCQIQNPIKKDYCFSRSLSDKEKEYANKCCYVEYDSFYNFCMALDESTIDEFLNALKEDYSSRGEDTSGIKATCSPSSFRFIKVNNLIILVISLFLL